MRWLVIALVVAACGDNYTPDDSLALTTLVDTNPDPTIVEVELLAMVGASSTSAASPPKSGDTEMARSRDRSSQFRVRYSM